MRIFSESLFFPWASTETEAPSSSPPAALHVIPHRTSGLGVAVGPRPIGFQWQKAHRDQELDLKPAVLKDSAAPLPEQEK